MDFIIKFLIALILLAIVVHLYLFYRHKLEEKNREYWEEIKSKFNEITGLNIANIKDIIEINLENKKEKLEKLQIELNQNPLLSKLIRYFEKKEKDKNSNLKNEKQEIDECNSNYEVSNNNFKNTNIMSIIHDNLYFGMYSKMAFVVLFFTYIFLNIYYLHIMGIPIQTLSYNYTNNNQYFNIFEFPFIVATILILFFKQLHDIFLLLFCYTKSLSINIFKEIKESFLIFYQKDLKTSFFISLNVLFFTIYKYRFSYIRPFIKGNKQKIIIYFLFELTFICFSIINIKKFYNIQSIISIVVLTLFYLFSLNYFFFKELKIKKNEFNDKINFFKKFYEILSNNQTRTNNINFILFISATISFIIIMFSLNEENNYILTMVFLGIIGIVVSFFTRVFQLLYTYSFNSLSYFQNIFYIFFMFYIFGMFIYTIITDFKEIKVSRYNIPIYIYDYTLALKYAEISNFLKPIKIKHDEESQKVLFAGETKEFIYYYDIDDFNNLVENNYSENDICKKVDYNSTAIFKNALIKIHKEANLTKLVKLANFRNSCRIIQKEGTEILGFCMDNQEEILDTNLTNNLKFTEKENIDMNLTKDSKNISSNFIFNSKGDIERYRFNGVNFDFSLAKLKEDSSKSIKEFANFLKNNPTYKAEIRGHTDNLGNDDYNTKLSEKRAIAVYDKLISYGISKDRLSYKGCGERCPLYKNDTEENRAKNRRVEAVFTEVAKL